MSQPAPNAPSIVMNAAGNRQQVPLRDYLNARVAPFLKTAITESLGVEAEFPLQWLGECLIHQSILYEGNPDSTNIRERFVHKFEDPKPQEQPVPAAAPTPALVPREPTPADVPPTSDVQEQTEVIMNEVIPTNTEPVPSTSETAPLADSDQAPPVVPGVKEEGESSARSPARDDDTEMGGIS